MHSPAHTQDGHPRLVILSAVRFLRESLDEILQRDGALSVLGLCATLEEACALCRAMPPDLLLLDAGFPGGTQVVGPLHDAAPQARVVAFAVAETEENVIGWAEAGAAGYVPSTAALGDLVALLLGICRGYQPCSGAVAAGMMRRIASTRPPPAAMLTDRERQIVRLLGAGMSNKDIARQLNIGVATTKSHVHNLLSKLNIQRRGQAAGRVGNHIV